MRGLLKVLPQFPRSVLEKKILPGLVDELRDGSTLALVLPNIFAIAESASARLFSERVLGRLKEVFVNTGPPSTSTEPKTAAAKIAEREKDAGKEGGLTVVLANLTVIMAKTTAREFKDDILPVYQLALESPTHALQDLALRSLHTVLPKLDFPTLKNDVFPLVAGVFTRTSSLGIKIRGLEAFKVLCGGTPPDAPPDAYASQRATRKEDCPALDKYTIQEKIVPLLKGIKTKEPAVMMAALDVFAQIGGLCDREVVAMELLPGLWAMSLGPLLGLAQVRPRLPLEIPRTDKLPVPSIHGNHQIALPENRTRADSQAARTWHKRGPKPPRRVSRIRWDPRRYQQTCLRARRRLRIPRLWEEAQQPRPRERLGRARTCRADSAAAEARDPGIQLEHAGYEAGRGIGLFYAHDAGQLAEQEHEQ